MTLRAPSPRYAASREAAASSARNTRKAIDSPPYLRRTFTITTRIYQSSSEFISFFYSLAAFGERFGLLWTGGMHAQKVSFSGIILAVAAAARLFVALIHSASATTLFSIFPHLHFFFTRKKYPPCGWKGRGGNHIKSFFRGFDAVSSTRRAGPHLFFIFDNLYIRMRSEVTQQIKTVVNVTEGERRQRTGVSVEMCCCI